MSCLLVSSAKQERLSCLVCVYSYQLTGTYPGMDLCIFPCTAVNRPANLHQTGHVNGRSCTSMPISAGNKESQ